MIYSTRSLSDSVVYFSLQNNGYTSMDEIEKDLNLLVKNAHAFNEPGSQVYKVCVSITCKYLILLCNYHCVNIANCCVVVLSRMQQPLKRQS